MLKLDRADIKIAQAFLEAVRWDEENGKALMQRLRLQEVVKQATLNRQYGEEILNLLLDRRGPEIKITEEVLQGTMSNSRNGSRLIKLLLNHGVEIKITDKAYEHAASLWHDEDEMTQLLRNRRAADPKEADLRAAEPKKGMLSYYLAVEESA